MKEYYEDSRFCEHCNDYTNHKCHDDGHERDSSWDYQECLVCFWYKYGMSTDYSPPIDYDDLPHSPGSAF